MTSRRAQRKADLLDRLYGEIDSRLASATAEPLKHFAELLYREVAADDVAGKDIHELYGATLSLWQFMGERTPGEHKLRVLNPRYKEHGWDANHTVIEIVNDDMPFLVDSVVAEINRQGLAVHLVMHPVLQVWRKAGQGVTAVALGHSAMSEGEDGGQARDDSATRESAIRESAMHIQVTEVTDRQALDQLYHGIDKVLRDVRAAVADWRPMRAKLHEVIQTLDTVPPAGVDPDALREALAFLRWLDDDNFTFLGYRPLRFEGDGDHAVLRRIPDSSLGVLTDEALVIFDDLRHQDRLPPMVRAFMEQADVLIVTKANRRATVHRPVHMDTVGVKTFDEAGRVTGEHLFVGLLTNVAYNRSVQDIPLLRRKFQRTIERAGFSHGSHSGKALINVLEQFPRDELFQTDEDSLFETALGILHLQDRQKIALFARTDPFERYVSCLVYTPRDRYSQSLRQRFSEILQRAYAGTEAAYYTKLDDDAATARMHFIIKTRPGEIPAVDPRDVEESLREGARSWTDKLRDELIEAHGEERGIELTKRYGEAFPASYQERFIAAGGVADIEKMESLRAGESLVLSMYRPIETPGHQVRFKVYHPGTAIPLSDIMPTLENLGLRVIGEVPFEIDLSDRHGEPPRDGGPTCIWINDFELETRGGRAIALEDVRAAFEEAFARIWHGDMEDDGLNGLILAAGLHWRDVVILRCYTKYLRQARMPYSQAYMEETLQRYPAIAAALVRLFQVSFDPDRKKGRDKAIRNAQEAVDAAMADVVHLEEDLILRRFLNALDATLRTNFYQRDAAGQPKAHLSVKMNSQVIEDLPLPRPMAEIFVYSPRVEAVHLRGGKVARGGIRWSDRREDFRTEVLGLMKAQLVKNAVIVPVGSKGGFFVKRPPAGGDRAAQRAEGVACYSIFMRGMLDVTDNLADGSAQPPQRVVRHDRDLLGDDPYLVVAADKGTATFSDIANEISAAEYGFWLGDAFASGGSAGYDHKAMGITARGAWEAVKRHFREIGKDIQTTPFTCIGVGDMSGDVFGNGMLLSEHTRLIAAFNHLHIFVDPDPDPARSFTERKRLFDAAQGWGSYDTTLLSKGGKVYDRSAKALTLSDEIKALTGLKKDKVTPFELIHALLLSEAELLWFGGIGTYIKGAAESHGEVGDKANDPIRVDGGDLRVKVVGEGANLGATQRGRIDFALKGGRINTDAIDNSAGVDTSDHEVNIKILLDQVVTAGDMTAKQRNERLAAMTEDVAALVLRDNYLQTLALSLAERVSPRLIDEQARFMRRLERDGRLNRALEVLPDDEGVQERRARGIGLTRPELAILLAYSKITLYDALLDSDVPEDPYLERELIRYFPAPLHEPFGGAIRAHRLRRELIATQVVNTVINRTGPTFVHTLGGDTGQPLADIARAYTVVRGAFDLTALWESIQGLDNQVAAETQLAMMRRIDAVVQRATGWALRALKSPVDIQAAVDRFYAGVEALRACLPRTLTPEGIAALESDRNAWVEAGVPEDIAGKVAAIDVLAEALDLTRITESASGGDMQTVAAIHFHLGHRLGIDTLRHAAEGMTVDNQWQKQARDAILDELYGVQGDLTRRVLETQGLGGTGPGGTGPGGTGSGGIGASGSESGGPEAPVEAWLGEHRPTVERIDQVTAELRASPSIELAMLAVANRQLRALLAG